jgi:hypothetical protein
MILHLPRRFLLVAAITCCWAIGSLLQGCLLGSKKSSRKRGASELIERDSIFLDRIAEGAAGRLQFKTNRAALCELAYYSQEANGTPPRDNPIKIPCSSPDKPRQEFTERLENLALNTLYFVVITAWDPSSDKKFSDVVTVREGPSNSPSKDSTSSPDGNIREIFVGRLDLPLKVAEFHRHNLSKPTPMADFKQSLIRPEGCVTGVPGDLIPYREAAPNIGISNLASRDLASASAIPHKDYPDRLTMQFASINVGMDKWSLLYQANGRDLLVPARPIAAFASVIMSSGATYNFDNPQLTESSDPFRLDSSQSLKFSWTSSSQLTSASYVTVQVGRPNFPKSIFCTFSSEKKTGSIEPSLLSNLSPDKYVVSVSLITNLFLARENWLITTQDWRSGRIEK